MNKISIFFLTGPFIISIGLNQINDFIKPDNVIESNWLNPAIYQAKNLNASNINLYNDNNININLMNNQSIAKIYAKKTSTKLLSVFKK